MIPNGDNITAKALYNLHLPNVSQEALEADGTTEFQTPTTVSWTIV